jgi:threonine/homoserine/homoserine lactone efflux protein
VLTFAIAVLFLVGTPGPGVLSLAGVGAAYGYRDGVRYMIGLFFGNLAVALAVLTGLAAIMLAMPVLRTTLAIASALYLLWLAYKIGFAGARVAFIERPEPPGITGGVLLQAINPKAYAVNTAIFANFAFLPGNPALEAALKLLIFNALWIVIHIIWLWLGVTIRRLDLPERTQRKINLVMALAMLGVVVLAAVTAGQSA